MRIQALGLALALLAMGLRADQRIWPRAGAEARGDCGASVEFLPGGAAVVRTQADLPWPGLTVRLSEPIDLSMTNRLLVAVSNRTERLLRLFCDVKARGVDSPALRGEVTLMPKARGVLAVSNVPKVRPVPVRLEAMEGFADGGGNALPYPKDLDKIQVIGICAPMTARPAEFSVVRIVLSPDEKEPLPSLSAEGFFPFVDEFGQFRHADWPGKVHSEEELRAAAAEEDRELSARGDSPIPDADRFGGWAKGPQLKATGFFRTEKVKDKWWLVDPDGHLFFSQGVNSVGCHALTAITAREDYFEKVPARDDPVFGACFVDGSELAPPRGFYRSHCPYVCYDFARANLIRKYGEDWRRGWCARTHRRLRAWGLNTLGNWSDAALFSPARTPYAVWVHLWCAKPLSVDGVPFPDVFSDEFRTRLDSEMKRVAFSADDPWCVGWFVDNEIGWGHTDESLAVAAAAAPEGQPAKAEFRRWLKARRGGAETPVEEATAEERRAFHEHVAETYFRLTREAVKATAPNRLYISCRFAFGRATANRMAAKYCDIVSWNLYRKSPAMELPSGSVDRPILVGEFHFGALDRGLLHTGIVPARNQRDRAAMYKRYVRLALASDNIVGVHWFAWRDQMVTGRGSDGECFQDGFVDVTDRPYAELVEAARELAGELYGGMKK